MISTWQPLRNDKLSNKSNMIFFNSYFGKIDILSETKSHELWNEEVLQANDLLEAKVILVNC